MIVVVLTVAAEDNDEDDNDGVDQGVDACDDGDDNGTYGNGHEHGDIGANEDNEDDYDIGNGVLAVIPVEIMMIMIVVVHEVASMI